MGQAQTLYTGPLPVLFDLSMVFYSADSNIDAFGNLENVPTGIIGRRTSKNIMKNNNKSLLIWGGKIKDLEASVQSKNR